MEFIVFRTFQLFFLKESAILISFLIRVEKNNGEKEKTATCEEIISLRLKRHTENWPLKNQLGWDKAGNYFWEKIVESQTRLWLWNGCAASFRPCLRRLREGRPWQKLNRSFVQPMDSHVTADTSLQLLSLTSYLQDSFLAREIKAQHLGLQNPQHAGTAVVCFSLRDELFHLFPQQEYSFSGQDYSS